jgi:hypothetical protein
VDRGEGRSSCLHGADIELPPRRPQPAEERCLHPDGDLFGNGPDGLLFHHNNKAFDRDMLARSVREPARSTLFPLRPTSLLTIAANQSCPGCEATTFATPRVRGGYGRASVLSSVNGGRVTGRSRFSSTPTRASPRGAKTKPSNDSSAASAVPRRHPRRSRYYDRRSRARCGVREHRQL